ncbi:MAG TPA: enolase C-terminal domain-like protein [Candidatus Binatia bacterium]|jgi:L-alanine-DL-glutamate epimerase-like enolase superfamily enzyme|nr:enolase C-terminal domain-like protein [Candidatus Binatia bacterium]
MRQPKITRVRVHEIAYEVADMGLDGGGFNQVYEPGARRTATRHLVAVDTDAGVTGEFVGINDAAALAQVRLFAKYLLGRNPLERELIHNDLKRAFRKSDRMGIGPVDCCLWDIAGKLVDAPVWQLLGGWRDRLPSYASTHHGDGAPGGLNSPEAFAEFALECKELGYPAMKIHPWGNPSIPREVANVRAVRSAVGEDFDLMLDPACEYNTFADTLKVGRACDDANFLWYEDPLKDGGISNQAYRKLRQLIRTPILIGEHTRGFELHVDMLVAEATDLVHCDPNYDMGITGVMKIAHACEGFGLDVQLHAPGPAQRACMAAIRNTNYYEMALVHPKVRNTGPPLFAGDYRDGLDAVDQDGCVPVPQGPGLGVAYDWDWIKAHEAGVAVYE